MFLVGLLSWWYGNGWRERLSRTGKQLTSIAAFFSIGQLALTLFSPFRQISAGAVNGSVDVQLKAFIDKTISRLIGAVVRLFAIIAGLVIMLFAAIFSLLVLAGWILLPLLIVAGILLTVIGWAPVKL
jgi:hypothetical protein